jgi:hypothetical protein
MCINAWTQILQVLLTGVIGVTAAYVAWQQWKINRLRLMLEHYERRFRVYQGVMSFLALVLTGFRPEMDDIRKFMADTAEAAFLFGADIHEYRDEIYKRASALWSANEEYRDLRQPQSPGYDHNEIVNALKEQKIWFADQLRVAEEKFKPYLNVNE